MWKIQREDRCIASVLSHHLFAEVRDMSTPEGSEGDSELEEWSQVLFVIKSSLPQGTLYYKSLRSCLHLWAFTADWTVVVLFCISVHVCMCAHMQVRERPLSPTPSSMIFQRLLLSIITSWA